MTSLEIRPSARGRSREGAWIEMKNTATMCADRLGRSREGAWIEIMERMVQSGSLLSLP